jgi:hypothetical protein
MCTTNDLSRVSRSLQLPAGFGGRQQRIETLLRSAADYGSFEDLLQGLDQLFAERRVALEELEFASERQRGAWIAPWLARIDETRRLLERMGAESLVALRSGQ